MGSRAPGLWLFRGLGVISELPASVVGTTLCPGPGLASGPSEVSGSNPTRPARARHLGVVLAFPALHPRGTAQPCPSFLLLVPLLQSPFIPALKCPRAFLPPWPPPSCFPDPPSVPGPKLVDAVGWGARGGFTDTHVEEYRAWAGLGLHAPGCPPENHAAAKQPQLASPSVQVPVPGPVPTDFMKSSHCCMLSGVLISSRSPVPPFGFLFSHRVCLMPPPPPHEPGGRGVSKSGSCLQLPAGPRRSGGWWHPGGCPSFLSLGDLICEIGRSVPALPAGRE